jgi:hypothetical protein
VAHEITPKESPALARFLYRLSVVVGLSLQVPSNSPTIDKTQSLIYAFGVSFVRS